MNNSVFIHEKAIVDTDRIGDNTRIWAFVHILKNVVIGSDCNICDFCFIESNVSIGNNVTVKSGIYIWEGVQVEDDVFLGPNVVFTNDIRPRSKQYIEPVKTIIGKGASIGANSTVLAGVKIGKYSLAGIGSVITRNIPDHALVYGNPAKVKGWVDEKGGKLKLLRDDIWVSATGNQYQLSENGMKPL